MVAPAPWTEVERAAWSPPERLSPSAWGERYHVVPLRGSAEPGPYRLDRTPYIRGILDVAGDTEHTEVILCKPVQVGGTEAVKVLVGYWVDTGDGAPIMVCLPDQKAAEAYLRERIQPLLETPRLARYLTPSSYDVRRDQIDLVHCSIHLAWTGSPQTMASRAIRFAVSDETDKAQDTEARALDLIRDRLLTFGPRSKHFILSSPTTSDGPIWREFQATADKRYYHVPCPHCGTSQRLVWEQVRWERRELDLEGDLALALEDELACGRARAWYECSSCQEPIEEGDRMRIIERGEWVSVLGPDPVSRRVAFHLSALYSPWVSFGALAAEFLRASRQDDLRNFRNGFLGLPQETAPLTRRTEDVFTPRAAGRRAGVVPSWATLLTAGADTQASGLRAWWAWVVRAWGPRYRSRLVAAGRADSAEELIRCTVDARFQREDGSGFERPLIVAVDAGGGAELLADGNTTWLVYQLARSDPGRVIPVKGYGGTNKPLKLIQARAVHYQPPAGNSPPIPTLLHVLDTEGLKDKLYGLIYGDDDTMWEESDCLPPGYATQMTAEEKTRVGLGKRPQVRWINPTRSRTDWWDATVYCLAAAHMVRADERATRSPPSPARARPEAEEERRSRPRHLGRDTERGGRFGARRRERW
ncbi:MAG: phage terminase large subunit family protein [Planctomycetes bacterium]|nr:phage terminase large subunit family protein [Planctomycetota bacterium]